MTGSYLYNHADVIVMVLYLSYIGDTDTYSVHMYVNQKGTHQKGQNCYQNNVKHCENSLHPSIHDYMWVHMYHVIS